MHRQFIPVFGISPYYKERKFFWQYFAKQGGHGIL